MTDVEEALLTSKLNKLQPNAQPNLTPNLSPALKTKLNPDLNPPHRRYSGPPVKSSGTCHLAICRHASLGASMAPFPYL